MAIKHRHSNAAYMGEGDHSAELSAVLSHMSCIGGIIHESLTKTPADYLMARMAMRCFKSLSIMPSTTVTQSKIIINGQPARWFEAVGVNSHRRILYLHGGGYVMGTIDDFETLISWLAVKTKCSILAIEYRLAPEHPFPAALNDARAAYEHMIKNDPREKVSPTDVYVAGDSAGGGLSLALAYNLRDEKGRMPDALVGLAPWADIWLDHVDDRVDQATLAIARANARAYMVDESPQNHLVSPLYGNPGGLPPTLLQVGENDPSGLADSEAFSEVALAAGANVRLEIWRNMPHVWHAFAPFLPEAEYALEAIAAFLDDNTSLGSA